MSEQEPTPCPDWRRCYSPLPGQTLCACCAEQRAQREARGLQPPLEVVILEERRRAVGIIFALLEEERELLPDDRMVEGDTRKLLKTLTDRILHPIPEVSQP